MSTSRPSRILAPLALVVCVIAVGIVFSSTMGGDEGGADKASTTQTSTAKKKGSSSKKRKTYVVKSGDSFSVISEKTGVPVEDLVQLNPGVDPQSLRTGQKLKLVASSSSS